jgi:hypothetical protein
LAEREPTTSAALKNKPVSTNLETPLRTLNPCVSTAGKPEKARA